MCSSDLVVFPEAHIWPYYTGIRPFSAVSFQYAVAGGVPALPVAVTYRAPKKGGKRAKKPRPTIHIGEPVYPDLTVGKKCAAEKLRERVYDFMVTKAASPDNYAFCRYVKRDAG